MRISQTVSRFILLLGCCLLALAAEIASGQYRYSGGQRNNQGYSNRNSSNYANDWIAPKPNTSPAYNKPYGNSGGYNPFQQIQKQNEQRMLEQGIQGFFENFNPPKSNGFSMGNDNTRRNNNWGGATNNGWDGRNQSSNNNNYSNRNGGRSYYYNTKQNSNQNYYTPKTPIQTNYNTQPEYSSSRSLPSNTVTASSEPVITNTVPKNTIPAKQDRKLLLANHENAHPLTSLKELPTEIGERLSGELAGQLKEDYDSVNEALGKATDEQVAQVLDKVSTKVSPQELEAIEQHLSNGDFSSAIGVIQQAIDNHIANGGGPPLTLHQAATHLGALDEVHNSLADVKNGLQQGATAADMEPLLQKYQNAIAGLETNFQSGFFPQSPATKQLFEQSVSGLEAIQRNLAVEESLIAGPPSSPSLWSLLSPQPMYVVYEPGIPQQAMYYGGPDLIVLHSPTGEFYTGQMPIAEAMGLPIGVGSPAPLASDSAEKSRFVVLNPDEDAPTINFQLGGKNYSVEQGETLEIIQSGSRVVRYNDGQDRTVEYAMKPGTYNFRVEGDKLALYHLPIKVRIHNDNPLSKFHLLVDGEVKSIEPGESLLLKSDFPPVVEFDQGDGGEPVMRRLTENEYTVAINPKADSWDLFAASHIAGEAPPEVLAQDEPKPIRKPRW